MDGVRFDARAAIVVHTTFSGKGENRIALAAPKVASKAISAGMRLSVAHDGSQRFVRYFAPFPFGKIHSSRSVFCTLRKAGVDCYGLRQASGTTYTPSSRL